MAVINKDSANWRLYGGGGLIVGGVLWLIAQIVEAVGPVEALSTWLTILGFLVLGASGFFLAFGQTGSNGVVGAAVLGKLGFVTAGVGFVVIGLVPLLAQLSVSLPAALTTVGIVLVVIGLAVGAVVVWQKGVARGIARWIIVVPLVLSLVLLVATLGWITLDGLVLGILTAVAFAAAGVAYLLNRK